MQVANGEETPARASEGTGWEGQHKDPTPHPQGLDSAVMPKGLPESPSQRTGPWSLALPLPPAQVGGFLQWCQPLVSKDGATLATQGDAFVVQVQSKQKECA